MNKRAGWIGWIGYDYVELNGKKGIVVKLWNFLDKATFNFTPMDVCRAINFDHIEMY